VSSIDLFVLSPHPICLGHHPLSFRGTHLELRCACDEPSACVRRVLVERTCCPAEMAMRLVRRERERVVVVVVVHAICVRCHRHAKFSTHSSS
jgi:hypothetical protein